MQEHEAGELMISTLVKDLIQQIPHRKKSLHKEHTVRAWEAPHFKRCSRKPFDSIDSKRRAMWKRTFDRSGQEKTRVDWTWLERTRTSRTSQDMTLQNRPELCIKWWKKDRSGQNKTRHEGDGYERSGQVKTGLDWTGQESTWQEKNKQDKTGRDIMLYDRSRKDIQDITGHGRAGYDRTGQDLKEQERTGYGIRWGRSGPDVTG